ncbi:endonuclease V [Pedobacter sp. KR3-3]|uniref:Endonuclease V n=1 Tax=Pedobacter albus TaxID=3113905 RepID=A0ABU7I4Q2_9SPHI|nr:endonuclease V [Pedobacter sp. KR3-3]MEE1944306.1 endonuclease V [Pedobacter sp. KR3-3]
MIDYNQLTVPEVIALQKEMRKDLRFEIPDQQPIHTIAGADISYNKDSNLFYAAIVVLSYPQMTLKAYSLATGISDFPYIPGFLGFREVPTLLEAWELLPVKPDVVVLDGQGILHPRRMGIASHFGVLTHQATIGCAKNSLYGKYKEPNGLKYSFSEMHEQSTLLGYALRTKENSKPVYISPGYGLSLPKSLLIMKKCVGKYRIPEPTRLAHEVVNEFRIGKLKAGFKLVEQIPELF